jgi:hypothetical protein
MGGRDVTAYLAGRLTLGIAGPLGIGLLAWLLTGAAGGGRR